VQCAWSLRDAIERSGAAEIVLDFLRVRDFADIGLAVLANALTAIGRRVAVRGLGRHQLRMLEYCGLKRDEPGRGDVGAVQADPAERP
jgi:hypothetical protein